MHIKSSIQTDRRGEFRNIYRLLKKHQLLQKTPVILTEGDSWFSTPLAVNLLDHLVHASVLEEKQGTVWLGEGGLFFRAEKSGDTALHMFADKNVEKLGQWFKTFDFDLVLLSAGGNDFVGDFLKQLFMEKPVMSVDAAVQLVIDSGCYAEVLEAYSKFISKFVSIKPDIPMIAHSYEYPIRLGHASELTLSNIGLIALFKKEIGDWISKNVKQSLPQKFDQLTFARMLIDNFVELVLEPLNHEFPDNFTYVDLRGTLTSKDYWSDEMHPTSAGFRLLAEKFKTNILTQLPENKISHI